MSDLDKLYDEWGKSPDVYHLDDCFDFGKYAGWDISEVIEEDRSYMVWIAEKSTVKLGADVRAALFSTPSDSK